MSKNYMKPKTYFTDSPLSKGVNMRQSRWLNDMEYNKNQNYQITPSQTAKMVRITSYIMEGKFTLKCFT